MSSADSLVAPVVVHTFPWLHQKVAFNSRPDTARTLPTSLRSAPPCRLDNLAFDPNLDGGMGAVFLELRLHNVSASACQVRGALKLALVDDRGTVWQSTGSGPLVMTDGQPEQTIVLVPNSWAMSGPVAVDSSCGGARLTTRIRVALPGESAVRVIPFRIGGHDPTLCDPPGPSTARVPPSPGELRAVTLLAIPASVADRFFPQLAQLVPGLEVPPTVRRGSVLRYQLVLTAIARDGGAMDGGGEPSDGSTCPLYGAHLAGADGSFELRCDVPVILRQGQSVGYELQLTLPADAPLGPSRLSFRFLEPHLADLTAPVTIVR